MNLGVKLSAFAGGLAAAFAAAFVLGAAADPINDYEDGHNTALARSAPSGPGQHMETDMNGNPSHGTPSASADRATVAGLTVTEAGYTLRPATTTLPAGSAVPFRFTVTGPDGRPLTQYRPTHEKELHLIVVRRDLVAFEHVHPTRGADGSWSVPLQLTRAGTYRVFADFAPAAEDRTLALGADVAVGGDFRPLALPEPGGIATSGDYEVRLDGAPVAGKETELAFTVAKGGAKVSDLQPYLGAFGHLVSLRAGDLAYLHTHPTQDARSGQLGGPQVKFATAFPTAGTYRLFLDFRHAGTVRTAAFTVTVGDGRQSTGAGGSHGTGGHGH